MSRVFEVYLPPPSSTLTLKIIVLGPLDMALGGLVQSLRMRMEMNDWYVAWWKPATN